MTRKQDELRAADMGREGSELSSQQQDDIRKRFWQAVDEIRARNADKDPDEVYRDVTEVVEEVRQEQYERKLRAQDGN